MKNAQLWKRILNEGCGYDLFGNTEPDVLADQIIRSQIIVDSRTGSEDRMMNWDTFNNMAVPFERTWIEGHNEAGQLWGVLFKASPLKNMERELSCWAVTGGGAGPFCSGCCVVDLDASGNLIRNPGAEAGTVRVEGCVSDHMLKQHPRDVLWMSVVGIIGCGFDVLTLLGCKNVDLASHENDPKQVGRAVKRHGGNPESYRYHTLVVRPVGSRSNSPAQEIGTMPRHVCRGHFAEYGPQFGKGLLFGKYAGRFFIPPCVKGDKKNGVVEKDYEIPRSTSA